MCLILYWMSLMLDILCCWCCDVLSLLLWPDKCLKSLDTRILEAGDNYQNSDSHLKVFSIELKCFAKFNISEVDKSFQRFLIFKYKSRFHREQNQVKAVSCLAPRWTLTSLGCATASCERGKRFHDKESLWVKRDDATSKHSNCLSKSCIVDTLFNSM